MKKVILAAFVSGLFLSAFATTAKNTSVTDTYAVRDTDTTKKVMMTDLVAVNEDITTSTAVAVRDTDTTKKKMTTDVATANDDSKTQIDPAKLPDAVKATLKGDEYKDWQITNAYEIKGSVAYYEIELKKGDSENTVKLDKDGKKI
ncbi:hypothetical protein ACTHGU_18810 [Chitinophagaceae bacterium MMS25-I14]